MIGFLALYDPTGPLPDASLTRLSTYLQQRGASFDTVYREPGLFLLSSAALGAHVGAADGAPLCVIGDVTPYASTDALTSASSAQKSETLAGVAARYRDEPGLAACDLAGDHHFILWDGARRGLICGRDRLGCRPIFYARRGSLLVVASSLRLILALALEAPRVDEASVRRFVMGRPLLLERTYYQGVSRLPPGATLSYTAAGLEITPGAPIAPPVVQARADAPADFRKTFARAVESRLAPPDELAVMLSGGLDSSAITTLAGLKLSALGQPPVQTLSMVFDASPQWSERPFIEAVAAAVPCRTTIIDVDDYAPLEDFAAALDEQGGLFLAPGLIMSRRMYARAAALGARVVLDGHGGDEVVSQGWGRLHDLAQQQAWRRLAREVKGAAAITGDRPLNLFLLYFLRYGPLKPVSLGLVRLKRRLARLVGGEAAAVGGERLLPEAQRRQLRQDAAEAGAADLPVEWSHETRFHYATLTEAGQSAALETLNACAAAAAIEPRYPFWDQGMVDLCLSLEASEKLNGGWARLIMRKAVPEMPDSVRWRRDKLNFSPHLARGFVRHHSRLMATVFAGRSESLANFVDMKVAGLAYQELLTKAEAASGEAVQTVWRVMALALWLDGLEGGALAEPLRHGAGK